MPNPQFSDDEIQQRAYEIYQARGSTPGDPDADWQEAIRQLERERYPLKRLNALNVLSLLSRPFVWIEKGVIEPTANWLDRADIFRIIEKVSPVIEAIGVIAGAIIIPVVIWQVGDREQEAKERQERAVRAQTAVQNYLNQLTDTLTTGKLQTDEDLQTIVRASTLALLDNPDLQPDPELKDWENLRNDRKGQTIRYLIETGLVQVEIPEKAQGDCEDEQQKEPVISLRVANLRGIVLNNVNLRGVNLSYADLEGAHLFNINLSYASLWTVNFTDADLSLANLVCANLSGADLEGADLRGANLSYANLSYANLNDASNWTDKQLSQANLCNTSLPLGTNLDPDRDCKELGIP